MNCSKCGREMMVSHIEKEVVNGEEKINKVYVCLNDTCPNYSYNSKIKKQKRI